MIYKIDFNAINQVALQDVRTLLARWLPGGQYTASEYVVRNPTRHDNSPGSFSINIQTGKWNDFATGDCGSGLISL
jgi:putative DNA primase/helicase